MTCAIIAGLGFAPPKPSIKSQIGYYDFKNENNILNDQLIELKILRKY